MACFKIRRIACTNVKIHSKNEKIKYQESNDDQQDQLWQAVA